MAKDKSKKSSGDNGGFAKPSEAPAGGDGFKFASDENRGKLMIIKPLRADQKEDSFKPGEKKEVIVADVVIIDEKKPAKSEEHSDVWVFPAYVRGALRGYIGQSMVLGRLQNTEDTSGKKDRGNYYWELEDASDADTALAKEYLASIDPFAAPAEDDDEKPAKKKKSKK